MMGDRIKFLLNRLGEQLWVRPLAMCAVSIGGALVAMTADRTSVARFAPQISAESLERLLGIMSSSMLVIATFSVASMVSAYASASSTATPRSFPLIISDDVSQNALSAFIGAFIFSTLALIILMNGYYGNAGRFTLFVLTLIVFAIVVLTFVRWVDRIARLGRLGSTVDRVEAATAAALQRRRCKPNLGGVVAKPGNPHGQPVYCDSIGYVRLVDIASLQACAVKAQIRITVAALPGAFLTPGRPVAFVTDDSGDSTDIETGRIARAFVVGGDRTFDEDPRFGLVVLSEIASRALSPAVNDPGTAIHVIGSMVRLFALWSRPLESGEQREPECDRVEVPSLDTQDLFDDAFMAIARDGAGSVEVAGRVQKALASLAGLGDTAMQAAARRHSRLALARAEMALNLAQDRQVVQGLATVSRSS